MNRSIKIVYISIIVIAIVVSSVVFLLQEPLSSELLRVTTPYGDCLEMWDIIRNSMVNNARRTEYETKIMYEWHGDACEYYVYRWMPDHYPEKETHAPYFHHEYRDDFTEERKQELRELGYPYP